MRGGELPPSYKKRDTNKTRRIKMETKVYFMFVHENADGLWSEFPDLPGCMTDGNNLEELIKNSAGALESWLESVAENSGKLPKASGINELKKKAKESEEEVSFIVPVTGYLPGVPVRINITSTSVKVDEITRFARKRGLSRSELMVNATLDYIRANP